MRLLLATGNAHKAEEIQAILGREYTYITLKELPGAPAVVEDGLTFEANAVIKAVALATWASAKGISFDLTLADDSGLEVEALNNAPGVHSARFAALPGSSGNSSDQANCEKLLKLLENVPAEKRAARFRCVVAVADQQKVITTFSGSCEGHITTSYHGNKGFGYDPLFRPRGFELTFAELGDDVKNQISHRAEALRQVRKFLEARR